jgi:hypothetical protein
MRELQPYLGPDCEIGPHEQTEDSNLADHARKHCGEIVICLGIGSRQPNMYTDRTRLDQEAGREERESNAGLRAAGHQRVQVGRAADRGDAGESRQHKKGRQQREQQETQHMRPRTPALRYQKAG